MAYLFVSSNSDKVTLTNTGLVNTETALTITFWFKTSATGTTRLTVYGEGNTANSTNEIFVSINDVVEGRVRYFRGDASGTDAAPFDNGGYNDGKWHHVAAVSRAKNDHILYVDGVSVGTNTNNLSGVLTTDGAQIGVRNINSTEDGFFDGDISDLAVLSTALSLAQIIQLFRKGRSILNIGIDDTADYKALFPLTNDNIQNRADFFETKRSTTATQSDGPQGANLTTGLSRYTNIANAYSVEEKIKVLVKTGGSGAYDEDIIETGNIVFDENDADKPYKVYYTVCAQSVCDGTTSKIGMAWTDDLDTGTWTKASGPVADELPTASLEDPTVILNAGTYHMYCEYKIPPGTHKNIGYFTSSDGESFTLIDADEIPPGTEGVDFDGVDCDSAQGFLEDGIYYVFYEGRDGSNNLGETGFALGVDPNILSKSGSNPVLTRGSAGTVDDSSIVVAGMTKIGDTYWQTYGGSSGASFIPCMAFSTNRTSWTKRTVINNPSYANDSRGTLAYDPNNDITDQTHANQKYGSDRNTGNLTLYQLQGTSNKPSFQKNGMMMM